MSAPRTVRTAWLAAALCWAAPTLHAASFPEFVDPNPATGNQFGAIVVPLATGNVVITSPGDDAGGTDAGAVYLFSGSTGALISTLKASKAGDLTGGSVTALPNGNFVIRLPNWDNGLIVDAGAVTWGNGTTGVSGVVSSANSLVGSTASDQVGLDGVLALSNGNYVVLSPNWNRGAIVDAGAVTWGSGTIGVSGVITTANSLVGSTASDLVGNTAVWPLSNGNYVVTIPTWDNGAIANVGAVTWGNGTTGVSGAVSAANSLVGSTANDNVGGVFGGNAWPLSNGNYVVTSPSWDNGAAANVGAATWVNGATGITGVVSAANSLVGSTANNSVGRGGVRALSNGNYVVMSDDWDSGAIANVGAATWGNGATGTTGVVSAANSLVGSTANDRVGDDVTALANGNYVVRSFSWSNGAAADAGAATWGDGTTGVSGVVSAVNSLVGSTTADEVGIGGLTALTNGNYVVGSHHWHNGGITDAGAATWGDGTTGVTGVVSAANSLVGSTAGDRVGEGGFQSGVTALHNGNYVVTSSRWDNGGTVDAGAVTWGDGTTGVSGVISAANSLVGSTASDVVGIYGVIVLPNGNYVVASAEWDNGAVVNAGAATWGSGATGVTGVVSAANSLVGSTASDFVADEVLALANGNYVVPSSGWDNGAIVDVGAVTWGSGTAGLSGVISSANSLVGSTAGDRVGSLIALSDGNYVVSSANWDNGALVNAGAVTWGDGSTGITGVVSPDNSIVSWSPTSGLSFPREDAVNGHFISRFLTDGGGRVRVGPMTPFAIASAADMPGDQGGWLRLTLGRHYLDHVNGAPAVASYGVWRHVPNTITSSREAPTEMAAGFPPGTWEIVATVPAAQQEQYVVAVRTISDLAPNDFLVTAQTSTPSIWFTSEVASGQSADNLLLDVDGGAPVVALALDGVRPNPARGRALHVAFALPNDAPARLELMDVRGRRMLSREVGSLGAGRHAVNLAERRHVPAGIYWVLLTQGPQRRIVRAAVIE